VASYYVLEAVNGTASAAVPVQAAGARYRDKSGNIMAVSDMVGRRIRRGNGFKWIDGFSGPTCFQAAEVLADLHDIERELARNWRKYPADWRFVFPGEAQDQLSDRIAVEGLYQGKRCRVYGDADGLWAKELDPGPREGVHHELTGATSVRLFLEPPVGEVEIKVQRHTIAPGVPRLLAALKQVCAIAVAEKGLVRAAYKL